MKTKLEALRDAVEVVLAEAAGNKGRLFSDQEFLREVVDFANTGELPNTFPVGTMAVNADTIDGVRRRLRADLQALVDGRLTAADKKRIYTASNHVLMIRRSGDDGTDLYSYLPASFEAVVAHAMRLLLATPQDQQDLKQCKWRDCNRNEYAPQLPHVGKFFFVSQRREAAAAAGKTVTGKRPDRYCCEEHMRAAHRERATAATMARRKKLKEQKLAAAGAAAKHK